MTLIGRDEELAILSNAVDRGGAALLLIGEPGIGKSTLLDAAREHARARGLTVLATAGVELETGMPYAGLHRLLRPLLPEIDALDALHRGVLRAALGLGDEPPGEPLLVGLALLDLLSRRSPLAVVADDLHWLDRPSRDALGYVGRHLTGRPIVLLAAQRDGYNGRDLGIPILELCGLTPDAAARILDDRAVLSSPVRRRLLAEAAGNPLALIELPATADAAGEEPALLPISARLERAFAGRLRELPAPARALLLVAASDEASGIDEILRAGTLLADAPVPADALGPAVDAGLIAVDRDTVRYRHPLVRSAIYQSAPLAQRLAAHAALADALGDADRRTWHRAAATVRCDDDVADAVEAMAQRAQARGAILEAAVTLRRAAELTEDAGTRGERLLASAALAYEAGRADLVQAAVGEAERLTLDVRDRARAELLSEIFYDGVAGDVPRVIALVDDARQVAALGDRELALELLQGAAVRCWWASLDPAVRGQVTASAEALAVSAHHPRLLAIIACAAPLERGAEIVERVPLALQEAGEDPLGAWFVAMAAHAVADHALAFGLLADLAPVLRRHGRYGLLTQTLSMIQWDAAMLGDWEAVEATAAEGDRLAEETGQPVWGAGLTCGLSAAAAIRGDFARAERLAARAEAVIVPHGLADMHAVLLTARGIAAVTEGRHEDALAVLGRLFDPADPAHHYREQFGGVSFYAEAAAACGREDEARDLIARLRADAGPGAARALHDALGFADAILAGDEAQDCGPFNRGRLALAHGRRLAAQGRPVDADAALTRAIAAFDAAGANGWTMRARRQRSSVG
ncbi:ATP-binding protein, partial [Solirubrobacter soli]|uniref:ATP-binding protein n=1 Tax=Solirubrobacter soli TaxID=363832 RepID=UPI0003F8425E